MARQTWPTIQEIEESYPAEIDEFICPVCEKSFNKPTSLNSHMTAHDEGERETAYSD